MTYEVYIDVILIVNGVMDGILLAILNRILGAGAKAGRIFLGAAAGAMWACAAALVPAMPLWLRFLGSCLAVPALMVWIAFRPRGVKQMVQAAAGLDLTAAAAGGVTEALYEHTRAGFYLELLLRGERAAGLRLLCGLLILTGGMAGAWGLLGNGAEMMRKRFRKRTYCQVVLCFQGKEVRVRGLLDTGNCLRDPVSGSPVDVASAQVMLDLCPRIRGVIFVPYRAVGTESGILPAIRLDWMKVEMDHREYSFSHPLVAVSREPLCAAGDYDLLLQQEQWERRAKPRRPLSWHTGGKIHDDQSINTQPFSIKNHAQLPDCASAGPE